MKHKPKPPGQTQPRDPFADRAAHHRMMAVLDLVAAERTRQRNLYGAGVIFDDCADPNTSLDAIVSVAGEEFGEICEAVNKIKDLQRKTPLTAPLRLQARLDHLKTEFIQLAAVCVAAAESMEGRKA